MVARLVRQDKKEVNGRHYTRSIGIRNSSLFWRHSFACKCKLLKSRGAAPVIWTSTSQKLHRERVSETRQRQDHATPQALMQSTGFFRLCNIYVDYCRSQDQPMSRSRQSNVDNLSLLLRFIRATQQGNWELHKACTCGMLPWLFAYNRINYARYMTAW